MNKKNIILAVLGLLCSLQPAFSQNLSNKGKEFWVGYGHHQFMEAGQNNSQEMVLYLSADQTANVTVTIDGTTWIRNYVVPANSVIVSDLIPKSGAIDARLISLPCSFVPPGTPCGGEGVFINKGIHIVSNVPIVAYAHIYGSASSGASMLMPVETWGYSYVTLNSKQNYAANCFSWVYAIAQQDNTVIEVTPAAATRSGRAANIPYNITLMKGQIYQVMAGPEAGTTKPEMTGTKIKSIANASGTCYPIAVFAGSSRTSNPQACGSGGGDNDNQQCFPSQAWGKRYLTSPTSNSATPSSLMWNAYKIAVKDPGTVVTRNGVTLTPLANGTYYFESNTADYIQSNKPIMVAQFMTGGSSCQGGGGVGDPEMMYISPIEQGIKRVGFYRNTQEGITVNYLTLIIPTGGVSSLTIDGSATFSYTYPHPQLSGYTVVVKRWSAATTQAVAQSDSAFTAITYGLGSVESYGYNAGTFINNLNAVGSIFNTSDTSTAVTSHPFTCTNTPLKLSVLLAYQPTKLVWLLSQVGGGLTPNTDVTDNAPVQVGPPVMVNGIPYYKYSLPGNYSFSIAGNHAVPILATHPSIENCTNTEQLGFSVEVRGKPTAGFSFTHTGCILDMVQFNGPSTSANGYTLNQWLWTYPDATTANSQNPTHTFTTTGNQNVNLHMVTTEGCVADTIRTVPVFAKPVTVINAAPLTVCEGGTISFSETTTYGGSAPVNNYYWNFGNGTAATAGPHTITYANWGTYTIKHTAGVSTACISDTATRIVNVYAKPTTTFTYPAGCLPASGTVQFNSNAMVPDGQAITAYAWNFGDPASGAANTSALANPSHNYPTFGTYTITFSVTTANGCTKDTTVTATFNLSPTFSYPALASVCESVTGTVSVASASVTNGVPGTGVYHGPATTPAGLFSPATAGAGTHTIWYVYSATSGCTDSVSQTITVNPKPAANFTIAGAGCLPTNGNVQFNYTGSISAGQGYLWNFGDPASGAANTSTNANPTHNYNTGTYTITLTVTTTQGCVDDTTMTTPFTVRPALAYAALPAVCQSTTGTVSVASGSVTNGVTGTGVYHGPATDAAGNFNPSLAGAGTHTIWYVFTATGNCVDSISRTITVNPKPNASFAYPATCLSSTGMAQFTYNGSAATGYAWNFGDPASGGLNTSTAASPSHIYTNTGSHTITLIATDANGCTDDTSITTVMSVKPALNYPPLSPVCESVAGTVSVASATVTNGVTGTGVYHGPGTDASGNFNPAVAGGGTHTIWYVFTSTGNCVDSISRTITVGAKPLSSFSFTPTTACLPTTGQVQFTYNGSAVSSYAWNFGDPASGGLNTSTAASPSHIYSNTGSHAIILTVTGANGCTDDTTITRIFSVTPALNYPALTALCESVTGTVSVATATVTNGVTGNGVYNGPGTDAAGNFSPSAAGPGTHTITYTFTSTGNCIATTTSTITVNAKPNASFSYTPTAACLPTSGQVQFTYNGSAVSSYAWNFGDPSSGGLNTSTTASPSHIYSNTGSHIIVLNVTGANGCTDDTTITRTFSVTPALNYPALTALCESVTGTVSVATATVTNGVTGNGVYSGPGTDAAGNFSPSAAGPGTHTITYTFTSTGNCIATTTSTITVNAKPNASFAYSPTAACLPTTGQVQFTYNGSAVSSYAWNFGDPASGGLNTSTAASPSHIYSNTGSHTIVLNVTGANGCTDDTTITKIFSVTPALNYPALAPVCESVTGTVSVATATVTNGVTGNGVYSGPGTDAAGNFSPSAAGPGTHTITYTFTSTGNCIATATSTITIAPKPSAVFSANANICLDQSALITDNSGIASGSIATWNWNFGDNTTASNTTAAPFNHNYTTFGNYDIKLVTISDQGCVSDTGRQSIGVHAVPVADFTMPASVCMPDGAVAFQNTSVVDDNSGLTYQWSFGDLSGSTDTHPSHVYATSSSYNIQLTALSAFGCSHDTIKTFSAFFDKPVADFQVTPVTVCEGTPQYFVIPSSGPGAPAVNSQQWIFGDGTTSTESAPVKTYRHPGVYDVRLLIKTVQGCASDTSISQTVTVHLQPVIDAGRSFIVPEGTIVQFEALSNSTFTYLWTWNPGDPVSDNGALNPILQVRTDGNYKLTATGAGGCTASDDLIVKVLRPVKVPNAFSPNGDQYNQVWRLDNLNDYPGATVQIFNRYGQLVYSANGYTNPWDGTMKGKPLPVATYYYIIDLKNGYKPLNGSVTILR